eukprot:TRINITY_DN13421_c0_g1_i3.p1 TRINITY_DN13421_c0_g1~~TRINITY_DN13421_c0_g1_i3.p1  ORF type:complete len:184 (+),score=20.35 TRINITY_DN13421_c0_g1_i3:90-641(+)
MPCVTDDLAWKGRLLKEQACLHGKQKYRWEAGIWYRVFGSSTPAPRNEHYVEECHEQTPGANANKHPTSHPPPNSSSSSMQSYYVARPSSRQSSATVNSRSGRSPLESDATGIGVGVVYALSTRNSRGHPAIRSNVPNNQAVTQTRNQVWLSIVDQRRQEMSFDDLVPKPAKGKVRGRHGRLR